MAEVKRFYYDPKLIENLFGDVMEDEDEVDEILQEERKEKLRLLKRIGER